MRSVIDIIFLKGKAFSMLLIRNNRPIASRLDFNKYFYHRIDKINIRADI